MPLDVSKSSTRVCNDPVRALFYDNAGRFVDKPEKHPPLRAGTSCTLCGATDVVLHKSDSGPACAAQRSITSGRRRRATATDPIGPVDPQSGRSSFREGCMAVVWPGGAILVTPLPLTSQPDHPIELLLPGPDVMKEVRRRVLLAPPPAPFAAIEFGKNARWTGRLNYSRTFVRVSGPDGIDYDVEGARQFMAFVERLKRPRVDALIAMRNRIALGTPFEEDRVALRALAKDHPEIVRSLDRVPSPSRADPIHNAYKIISEG
jgi:hypothetical protein